MEKLILSCGRFVPAVGGDEGARVKGLEEYLVRLTEELELMLSELYYQIQEQKAKNAGLPYDEKTVELPDFLNFKLLADD